MAILKKTILKIAAVELKKLFVSPIAWFIIVIFIVQAGFDFTNKLERAINWHLHGGEFTNQYFFLFSKPDNDSGLLKDVQAWLFAYVPFLTMGLFSQENSSGTIKLLQSSPIKPIQIVTGKFIAIFCFGVILIGSLQLYLIAGATAITNLDFPSFYCGLFGLILLFSVYSAIGILMSSLYNNQAIAAVSTFAALAALNYLGDLGQQYGLVRWLTKLLQIPRHSVQILDGLLNTRDICYFILISVLFLFFTFIKLHAVRVSRETLLKSMVYLIPLTLILLLIWLASLPRFTFYFDTTENKNWTLSQNSIKIIDRINTPLKVHVYTNVVGAGGGGYPQNWYENEQIFAPFRRFLPDIRLDYTLYYDTSKAEYPFKRYPGKSLKQIAIKSAQLDGLNFSDLLTPGEIREKVNLAGENGRLVRQLEANGKTVTVRSFEETPPRNNPQEEEIATALKRLLEGPETTVFLSGNGERDISKIGETNYRYITSELGERYALINQGFSVDSLNVNNLKTIKDKSIILVIADPSIPFNHDQLNRLKYYIGNGGNLLLTCEPGKKNVFDSLLKTINIQLGTDTIQQSERKYPADLIFARLTPSAARFSGLSNQLFYNGSIVTMKGATILKYDHCKDFSVTPFLATINDQPVAICLNRKIKGIQQRIVVTGDADFMTEKEINRPVEFDQVNNVFVPEIFKWLSYGKYPVDIAHPKTKNAVKITIDSLKYYPLTLLGLIPIIFLITGSLIIIKRRRM